MNFKHSLLFSLFLIFNVANSFNITSLLGQYPDFSTFNNYLTQTQLANQINSRQTITVLAVDNSAMSPVSGKSNDVLKKIMSVHVVLDYYDVKKLENLSNKTTILTTLFQTSGQANGQQGFLNVTNLNTGSVVIGSAVKGATLGANLVKSIAAQPYNISVLQISTIIIPNGIENSNSTSGPPVRAPAPSPSKLPTTPPPTPNKAPQPSPAEAPTAGPPPKPSEAPAPSSDPPEAQTPAADVPGAPPKPDESTADAPAAEPPEGNSPNEGSKFGLSFWGFLVTVLSTLSLTSMTW